MKLSNQALVESIQTLQKLNRLELPVKVAFLLLRNIKEVDKSLESYNETRQKLIFQYADKDEEGNLRFDDKGDIIFKEGIQEKWSQDIRELLELKTTTKVQPISIHDLFKAEILISPIELSTIEFMLKD